MINYYFDNTHPLHPFVHSLEANPDSIAPDNALRIEPEFQAGFWPSAKGGKWVQVIDLRGQKAYDKQAATEVEINELGELADELTLIKPETEFDYWDGSEWVTDVNKQNSSIISSNKTLKDSLLSHAANKISVLQDAVELEIATDEEIALLKEWKKYRVLLNRLDVSDVDVVFPEMPDKQ